MDFHRETGLDERVRLSDRGLNVLGVVPLQEAVRGVALERSLQRVSQELGHAVVQLYGRSAQGNLEAVAHSL